MMNLRHSTIGTHHLDSLSCEVFWQTLILIRETRQWIKRLGSNPVVWVRANLIRQNSVLLIPLVVKTGSDYYEMWFNGCEPYGQDALNLLAVQDRLTVHFFADRSEPVRSVGLSNSLAEFSERCLDAIIGMRSWTMAEFDLARDKLYQDFPSPAALWEALETRGADL